MDGDGSAVRMVRGHPRPAPPFSTLATGAALSVAMWTAETRSVSKKDVAAVGATLLVAQPRFPTSEPVPDEAHAAACARVKQLQNAIDALDEKDPLVASPRAELQKVRSKARVVPVEDRIQSTTAFLERARKRESVARKELEVAQEDVRDGEARLERLRAEAAQDVCPPTVVESSVNAELERLRGLVAELRANSEESSTTLSEPSRVANPDVVAHMNAELAALPQERDALQASVQALPNPDNSARRKQARTLAAPSLDLVPVNQIIASSSTSTAMDLASAQDRSSMMESRIQSGAHQSQSANGFDPSSEWPPTFKVRIAWRPGGPGPAAFQETLIDSLEFDLTRVTLAWARRQPSWTVGAECSLEKGVTAKDSDSDTESLAGGEPNIKCQRRRLRLNWADEQEIQDSHEERLARVWRQLQRDSCSERQLVAVSARPIPVVAMDANDSSDGNSILEQPEAVGRQQRTSCRGNQGVLQPALLNESFRSLDIVDLVNVFEVRPFVMKTVPFFLSGTFKTALKASLHEIRRGQHEHDDTTETRGWKLFFCTDLQEVDSSRRRSCKKDSGSRCWKHPSSCLFKEQQQVADGDGGRRTRSNGGPHVPSNFANSGSDLRHDKR